MLLTMLKAKIHRAKVTQAELNYVGSITIDEHLLTQSGILEYEKVSVVNIDNGNRFETYVIKGEKNSGIICINGAAARLVSTGDKIIIMCYCHMDNDEISQHTPKILLMNEDNTINSVSIYEKHGPYINPQLES
ncbi:MAG: aspartate 1-decarboxylase [Proteobacteria bacterium]|nr:aspartate 1-decarboxylase [Pseudomonadota bacterium]